MRYRGSDFETGYQESWRMICDGANGKLAGPSLALISDNKQWVQGEALVGKQVAKVVV